MLRKDAIEARIRNALVPEHIEVIDESAKHIGHAGYQEGGESHFHLRLTARALQGKSKIEQHRSVHRAIGPDLMGQIHALSMEIKTQ